jgi:crossover junction endodeoxyribonuclease RuvC
MVSKKTERILGIDPGFGRTGFGVIEKTKNGEWKVVAYGCIETSTKDPYSSRIEELHEELKQIIKKYSPTHSAVEELFFCKNVTTAIKVGQARGVILLTLRQAKLPVAEFTPLQVKQSVTGYGKAGKAQVEKMIKIQFGLKKKIKPDDAADALAIALTAAGSLKLR